MSKNNFNFIIKKLVRMVSLVMALSIFSFILLVNSPIDPIRAQLSSQAGQTLTPEQKLKIAEYWGVNKPPIQRFTNWGKNVLHGDLGTSMIYNRPVSEILGARVLSSIGILIFAWIISGILGFLLGIVSAYYKDRLIDRIIKAYCFVLASSPVFWIGLVILIVFASWLKWFPLGMSIPIGKTAPEVSLFDRVYHMILPAFTLSIVGVVNIALHTRAKLIEVMESDYILYAKANGKKGIRLLKEHGLRNIALPALTLQFLSFSEFFGGSVLVEHVFSFPGLGSVVSEAGIKGDMALLLGVIIFTAIFVFVGNMIADILYTIIDPRIREGGDRSV